jgi:hypothetical protein
MNVTGAVVVLAYPGYLVITEDYQPGGSRRRAGDPMVK